MCRYIGMYVPTYISMECYAFNRQQFLKFLGLTVRRFLGLSDLEIIISFPLHTILPSTLAIPWTTCCVTNIYSYLYQPGTSPTLYVGATYCM